MKDVPYIAENVDFDTLKVEQRKRVSDIFISNITLQELIKRFEASTKGDAILNDDYWDIPIVLRDKFGVAKIEDINKSIEALAEAIDNLEAKLRNHRHDTTKTFTAKPEF